MIPNCLQNIDETLSVCLAPKLPYG